MMIIFKSLRFKSPLRLRQREDAACVTLSPSASEHWLLGKEKEESCVIWFRLLSLPGSCLPLHVYSLCLTFLQMLDLASGTIGLYTET